MPTDPSLPSLDDIRTNLHTLLISDIEDLDKFENWLDVLITETYGQVLCVNLFIDLKNRCLDTAVVANVIDKMVFAGDQARWAFYKYVEEHQDETFFNHLHGPMVLENDVYVRILPLADMIEYYLREPLKLPPLTYEAEQEVLERFFKLPPNRREKLGVVTEVFRGKMLNGWVTSKSVLDSSTAGLSSNERADRIRDRLGFSSLDSGKLVQIIYPANFDRAPNYVPTTLDSHFGSVYYLSTDAADDWGLTCCLNPLHDGLRERVHKVFDGGLTDEFEMTLVGEITCVPIPNPGHLINEALKRASS